MSIVDDLKTAKIEEKALAIMVKANAVRDSYGHAELIDFLFEKPSSREEYEDVSTKAGSRGYNYLTGGLKALQRIDLLSEVAQEINSSKAEKLSKDLAFSYDQICVDAIVAGIESGRIPEDAAKLSDDEFLAKWKASTGETEQSIMSTFNEAYHQTNDAMQALYNQQTQG